MVVIDVANVMGARADGWWRDRAGAAARLCREVAALAGRGMGRSFPGYVLVLEGQARAAAAVIENEMTATGSPPLSSLVRVVSAAGSGDDSIVAEVAALGGSCLVVTADRELRRRCEALGAAVTGPGWLLGFL